MAKKTTKSKRPARTAYDPDRAFGTSIGKKSRKSTGFNDVDIKLGGDVRIPGADDVRTLDNMSTSPALRGRNRSAKKTKRGRR